MSSEHSKLCASSHVIAQPHLLTVREVALTLRQSEPVNPVWLELVHERYEAEEKEEAKRREDTRRAAEAKAREDAKILERERRRVEKWNAEQHAASKRAREERREQERAAFLASRGAQ
jgi:hypothetical protein